MKRLPDNTPAWPTRVRSRMQDGRLVGVDGSVWAYFSVPMAPVMDARSPAESVEAAEPLLAALEELASATTYTITRRSVAKKNYRDVHLLLVNVPQYFVPERTHPYGDYLSREHGKQVIDRRVLLLGVRLKDKVGAGGFREALDSVVETIVGGGAPLSDFDHDFEKVRSMMTRSGLMSPSNDDIRLANSWWNHGDYADTPMLIHADHLHVFTSADSVRLAQVAGVDECTEWDAKGVPGQHSISFASVQDLDLNFIPVESPVASWMSALVEGGALAISVRGNLEPGEITRQELRRQRKRFIDDVNERAESGKMERAEQTEMLDLLGSVEGMYGTDGSSLPTLAGTSILAAFDGTIGDITQVVPPSSPASMAFMAYRQSGALAEMMLCSNARQNPNLHDLPFQTIGCSGMPSLNMVGDDTGALIGFTERDSRPAFLSRSEASSEDSSPIMVVPGQTGSGKAQRVALPIPTPQGYTLMGDLREGDLVLGRDGKPCRVTRLFPINQTPDLYRLTLSDGQQIVADHDHQWIVSDWQGRNQIRHPKRRRAVETWEHAQQQVQRLVELAEEASGETTMDALLAHLEDRLEESPWPKVPLLREALDMVDAPYRMADVTVPLARRAEEIRKVDPVTTYDLAATLRAVIETASTLTGGNAARWAAAGQTRITAARAWLEELAAADDSQPRRETAGTIADGLLERGAQMPSNRSGQSGMVRRAARSAGLDERRERREVVIPVDCSTARTTVCEKRIYDAAVALKSLAVRLAEQYHTRPVTDAPEKRMTTGEMLATGVRRGASDRAEFAIRVTAALDLPEADLPVDPYVFGAWLGDGSTGSGNVIASNPAVLDDGLCDMTLMREQLEAAGYPTGAVSSSPYAISVRGLRPALRRAGALGRKHIPMTYLRASAAQRLAVLQGLMDTDGTVDANGCCELSLSDKTLAGDALELIRSLGIKASASWDQPASYRDETGELVVCKDRHRIHFTTDRQVFRLPRKAARLLDPVTGLPRALRETATWLYITSIEKLDRDDPEYGPARCITVDSPDHTYLCGQGYVPTSNTMVMLKLAEQFARNGPVVVFDPKQGSNHDAVALNSGGRVYSLDTLLAADGVFDPIRFSPSPEVGVELASSMLMSINPWGTHREDFEVPLQYALDYGVRHGASCIGQALALAKRDLDVPALMIDRVEELSQSSPQFRAIVGINPQGEGLRASAGITLIKVGNAYLDLPEPGDQGATVQKRIAMALIRMVVFGSAMAVAGRDGVVMLDEAWIVLGAGRSEVERLGRLARSQRVLPMLFTQRVTDATKAGLAGYISRGLILPMEDPTEAAAACELFKLEPTPERMSRLTAKAFKGGNSSEGRAPNWNSMRALRDPITKQVLRGSVGIYVDLAGRAIPVEVTLSDGFLKRASTSPRDIEARAAEQLAEQEALAAAARRASEDPGPDVGGDLIARMF